jgi:hypothetical protein
MQNLTTRTIQAFDLTWQLSAATIEADQGREEIRAIGLDYHATIAKPAAKLGAYNLLFPFFPDILAATDEIEGNQDLLLSWFESPGEWVKWVRAQMLDGKRDQLTLLWRAAKDLNPQWYPDIPLSGADEETQQAAKDLAELNEFVAEDVATNAKGHPNSKKATGAAAKVADFVEAKAEEVGNIGPVTFSGKGKGAA